MVVWIISALPVVKTNWIKILVSLFIETRCNSGVNNIIHDITRKSFGQGLITKEYITMHINLVSNL